MKNALNKVQSEIMNSRIWQLNLKLILSNAWVFLKNRPFFFVLATIHIICTLIVNPVGEFPLNDDWAYAKSLLNWHNTGGYSIGWWPAMTLFTHLLWGLAFVKLFGFSFFVLRLSTIISSFIGGWLMFLLVKKISNKPAIGFVAALTMWFNPILFNTSYSYMTDTNFNTLLVLGCYLVFEYFTNQRITTLLLAMFVSGWLIFTRQLGLMLPTALFLTIAINKNWKHLAIAFVCVIILITSFKFYESFLKQILPANAAYQYSSSGQLLEPIFWKNLLDNFSLRYRSIIVHLLVYTLPFSALFFTSFFARENRRKAALIFSFLFFAAWIFFDPIALPMGNVFVNFMVGPETFFESLSQGTTCQAGHMDSPTFEKIMYWIKIVFSALSSTLLLLFFLNHGKEVIKKSMPSPGIIFLLLMLLIYVFMLSSSEFYFDRYNLPTIAIFIILLAHLQKYFPVNYTVSVCLLLVWAWVSVLGTKDYFTWNRARWQAYYYMVNEEKVDRNKVNGGFETICWNDGKEFPWWYHFHDIKSHDYLIQYWQEPGFKPYKEFKFKRYWPIMEDKLILFKRDSLDLKIEK